MVKKFSTLLRQLVFRPDFLLTNLAGILILATAYYWLLLKVSNLQTTINNISGEPVYFAAIKILVPTTLILFGLNFALAIFLFRASARFTLKNQGGSFLGALIGSFGAACPICGAFLLSLIGVSAGLTALPFAGLEIWTASTVVMALAFGGSLVALDKSTCDPKVKTTSCWRLPKVNGRYLIIFFFLSLGLLANLYTMLIKNEASLRLATEKLVKKTTGFDMNAKRQVGVTTSTGNAIFDEVRAKVLPAEGVTLSIRWGDWLPKLVEAGVIDGQKIEGAFAQDGGLTQEQKQLLTSESDEFITVNEKNSWFLVTVFWPLGLANKTEINKASSIAGDDLFNFASTGGWTLGTAENGGEYFNKYEFVKLTSEQERLVQELAENSYRPCCDNSTFYQDCNHGSALLGLLELGASQGLSKGQLARAALVANSFWFPQNYLSTATYLKAVKGIDWEDINPEEVLGADYSSATGAGKIGQEVASRNLIPENAFGARCGV
ncbi:hypothetical protein HYT60_01060 [Candidatus Woesebacteria bacterium]|nr:hypothetical protein [Candidatus Woesebacteria bacterium]